MMRNRTLESPGTCSLKPLKYYVGVKDLILVHIIFSVSIVTYNIITHCTLNTYIEGMVNRVALF